MQTLGRLDHLFCKYLYKGKNPFASRHVKQTPHDPELMWASNMYIIVIKVGSCKVLPFIIGSFNNTQLRKIVSLIRYAINIQGRTVDLKTLTLIEEPAAGEELDNADEEFERILRESGEQCYEKHK